MKQKTQKVTLNQKIKLLFQPTHLSAIQEQEVRQTAADFKHSVLVVSLFINLFFLTAWLVLQVTTSYNDQLIAYLNNH